MIAVIIPCLNQSNFTKMAVTSIGNNSWPHDLKFIFIDNGSTDDTNSYLKSLNQTLITNKTNMGVTHAWNQGLGAALDINADIICLMNNDIITSPRWLDSVVQALNTNPKHFYFPNGSVTYTTTDNFNKQCACLLPSLKGKTSPGKCGWGFYFNRKTVQDFYPIPEDFKIWYNDDYIYYRLMDLGYTALVLQDSLVYHFGSKTLNTDMNKYGNMINADRAAFLKYAKEHLPSADIRVRMGY